MREEIRRLGKRILPLAPSAAPFGLVALSDEIAVGEQHGKRSSVGVERRRVARHHVGPVDEPGDAPEALRLALRDEAVLRRVEAFELRVLLRDDARDGLERERIGDVAQRELLVGRARGARCLPSTATETSSSSSSVEHERARGRFRRSCSSRARARGHRGCRRRARPCRPGKRAGCSP